MSAPTKPEVGRFLKREIVKPPFIPVKKQLTKREVEILLLIGQGLFSKEIADRLNISTLCVRVANVVQIKGVGFIIEFTVLFVV